MEGLLICPACGNQDFFHYLDTEDFSITRQKFSLQECQHCRTLATSPQPDQSIMHHYYQSEKYISHTNKSDSRLLSLIYRIARKASTKGKRKLIEKYSSGKTILDLGCGTGHFLTEMKKAGWQVYGVEPADIARQQAETQLKQPLFKSLQEANGLMLSAVSMWHVLEHIHHPDKVLKQCYQLLQKKGLLVVAVPNYRSFDAGRYKNYWAGYDVPRHLWHFNKESMYMLMHRQGFCIKKILPMKLDSYYVSLLSEHYKHPTNSAAIKYWHAFIAGLKSNLKARKTGQYSSLIYIATKNDETTAK